MESIFLHNLANGGPLIYILIFIALFLEGEVVLFTAAFLVHQGYIKFSVLLPVAYAGVIIGDIIWYRFGLVIEEHFSSLKRRMARLMGPLDGLITKKAFHSIIIAKFAYGLNHPAIIRFAQNRFPLRRFVKIDLVAAVIWLAVILTLGYLASVSTVAVKHYLKYAEVGIVAGVLVMLTLTHLISKRVMEKK